MQPQEFDVEFGEVTRGEVSGVSSVNGMTGAVILGAGDVGADTSAQVNTKIANAKAQIEAEIPTKTSDLTNDSDFQNATQVANAITPVSNKVNAVDTAINKNVVNSVGITASSSTDTLNLTDGKINIKTGTTTSETIPFPVASATSAGVMNSATYQGLVDVTDIANGLLEGAVAVTGLAEEPTQTQISNAWETATGRTTLMNRAVVYDVTNQKLWTYYTNTTTWYPVTAGGGSVDVQPWTNTQAGIVKGSTQDGQIFAENDGTGSVNGWDEVKTDISNLENAGYQTESEVDTKIATAIAPLESDIDDLETGKQDALTAGDNITISNNEISADVPELLTTTGQSTTAGMTQKAITDALASAGGAKVLTTADYNYPVDNPTMVLLPKIGNGVYISKNDITVAAWNREPITTKGGSVMVVDYDTNYGRTKVIILANNKAFWYEVDDEGATRYISGEFLKDSAIVNNLATTSEGYVLDARQGKALKDYIGDLTNLDTTDKTNLVAAINEVAGNAGEAKVLTTDDYNWPTSNPDGVALWLLPSGMYCGTSSSIKMYASSTSFMLGNRAVLVSINSGSAYIFSLTTNETGKAMKLYITDSTGTGQIGSGSSILLDSATVDNLTSTSTTDPLSANQGKVLKGIIDSLITKGAGAPTTSTVGTVGQLYEDTTNGDLYQCTAVSGSTYTWEAVGGGSGPTVVQTTGTSTTDVMSQNATTRMVYGVNNGIAIGPSASTSTNAGIALGNASQALYTGVSIGYQTNAREAGAIALGSSASTASGKRAAVAIGESATANAENSIALGRRSTATVQGEFNIGNGTATDLYNNTGYRLLTGLHDPVNDHDAATKKYVDDHSGGGGGELAHKLTTADYNYPASNPNSIALWLLEPGVYWNDTNDSLNIVWCTGSSFEINQDLYTTYIVGGKYGVYRTIISLTSGGSSINQAGWIYNVNPSNGASNSPQRILWSVSTNDNLTSTSTWRPLSANQGKVLNEKIQALEARIATLEGNA